MPPIHDDCNTLSQPASSIPEVGSPKQPSPKHSSPNHSSIDSTVHSTDLQPQINASDSNAVATTDKMTIWVDADACPLIAKDLIIKTALRTQTPVIFVANQLIKLQKSPLISMKVVGHGFDVADDYIAEQVVAGDLVITSDIPLANDVIDKQGKVLTPHGIIYDKNNIKQKLNARDFMDTMRGTGMLDLTQMGGQKPYGDKDKKAFADGLNKLVR